MTHHHSTADAGLAGIGSLRLAGRKESTEVIMLLLPDPKGKVNGDVDVRESEL